MIVAAIVSAALLTEAILLVSICKALAILAVSAKEMRARILSQKEKWQWRSDTHGGNIKKSHLRSILSCCLAAILGCAAVDVPSQHWPRIAIVVPS